MKFAIQTAYYDRIINIYTEFGNTAQYQNV